MSVLERIIGVTLLIVSTVSVWYAVHVDKPSLAKSGLVNLHLHGACASSVSCVHVTIVVAKGYSSVWLIKIHSCILPIRQGKRLGSFSEDSWKDNLGVLIFMQITCYAAISVPVAMMDVAVCYKVIVGYGTSVAIHTVVALYLISSLYRKENMEYSVPHLLRILQLRRMSLRGMAVLLSPQVFGLLSMLVVKQQSGNQ